MNTIKSLRIIIASPDDLLQEREICHEIINEFNNTTGKNLGIHLESLDGGKLTSSMGRPEEIVLKQFELNSCDLFIGLLWTRFGTPTGKISNISSTQFQSGTQEEFENAYRLSIEKGSPQIIFYKCNRDAKLTSINPEQLKDVNKFFDNFKHTGEHPGLYKNFDDLESLRYNLRVDLNYFCKMIGAHSNGHPFHLSTYFETSGFINLFLPENNELRSSTKAEILKQAKYINLIASSGNAFIGIIGHRYRDILNQRLTEGCKVRIILSNPYSISSLLRTIGENPKEIENIKKLIYSDQNNSIYKKIVESLWYKYKLNNSLQGLQLLKSKFKKQLKIKFTKFEVGSSILVTDTHCFFEPYINVNLMQRTQADILTFDMQVTSKSHITKHFVDYFELMWNLSDEVDLENIEPLDEIKKLIQYLK